MFYIFVFVLPFNIKSQNLVLNPSFEEFYNCPEIGSNLFNDYIDTWIYTTNEMVGYINSNCGGGIPNNSYGYQFPRTGDAYSCVFVAPGLNYLEGKLRSPLKRDSLYYVGFFYSLADRSNRAINNLSAHLSTETNQNDEYFTYIENPVVNGMLNRQMLENDSGWVLLSSTYKARGGEKYILLGNLIPYDKSTLKRRNIKNSLPYSVYYIDDVFVIPIKKADDRYNLNLDDQIMKGDVKSYVFSTIYFDTNQSGLTEFEANNLLSIVVRLRKTKYKSIELSGHTDDEGTLSYNMKLSQKRAETINNMLINKGIDSNKIVLKGYGYNRPKSENNSLEGQKLNRRVEIRLVMN